MKKTFSFVLCLALLLSLSLSAFAATPNNTINVLYTNDVHCAIDKNLGYDTLSTVKQALLAQGNEVVLVDNGDAFQGGNVGVFSKGEYIVDIMNAVGYDVAVPGNHDFDYGIENFFKLIEKAEFPYISCNFTDLNGTPFLDSYFIKEVGGVKLGFVGICTDSTMLASNPLNFLDENGETVCDFCRDESGEKLYNVIQKAVDDVRAEGVDYVIAMAHLGIDVTDSGRTSSDVITHTHGIDVMLDAHSHTVMPCEKVKNDEGKEVLVTSTGTTLENIGCLTIGTDGKLSTALIDDNGVGNVLGDINKAMDEVSNQVIGHSKYDLYINDPKTGERMVRNCETNLSDFCADAYRTMLGADIAIINGGGVRADLPAGDITYGDLLSVNPFGNTMVVCKATGQQILDMLELGVVLLPASDPTLMHVSGMSYTVDLNVEPSVEVDAAGNFIAVSGERRVKDVMVGDEPIDPEKIYTLAGTDFTLRDGGEGMNMFLDCEFLPGTDSTDIQLLIDYLTDTLGGEVSEDYADPYGQGRLTIIEAK